jgi:ABC-type Fe3+-hydroxamate transport system substrate-binding protein
LKISKRITAALLSAAMVLGAFSGCGFSTGGTASTAANPKDWPATVNGVTLSGEPAGVAVVSPNLADVVLSLGYELQLKGKSKDCTQSAVSSLTNVSLDDPQQMKKLGATVVLTDTKPTDTQQDALNKAGVQAITIPAATSRTNLQTLYTAVGTAIKGKETGAQCGEKAAKSALLTIDSVTRLIPKSQTVTTGVYLYDVAGNAATGDTMAGTLLTAAGITNVAAGSKGGKMAVANLKTANPSLIFCPKGLRNTLQKTDGYKDLTAVQNNKVYEMDPLLMKTQGENMLSAVTYMAGVAYPALLKTTSAAASSSSGSSAASGAVIPNSTIPAGTTLQQGDQNDNVKAMQNRLKELGYLFVNATGLYGDGTVQSVKDFQTYNQLDTTGVADEKTLTKLFSKDAASNPDSNG